MSDDAKTRQARYRRHQQGDHSMCTRRCKAARTPLVLAEVPVSSPENIDPAAALKDLAVQLLAAYRADPSNASLAREARATLLALAPSRDTDVMDELALLGKVLRGQESL